jgi:hypothetical protein
MESEAAAYGAPYLGEFRLFTLMTLRAVRPDICKAWNDHDVRPEVLRHGNIALGVRHKIHSSLGSGILTASA